jgi:hypothetical protein
LKKIENRASGDRVAKDDLLDEPYLYETLEFDPEYQGNYGVTPRWVGRLVNIKTGVIHDDVFLHGEAARQVGRDVEVGEVAPGVMTHGTNEKTGRQFYGVTWITEGKELEAAEAALLKLEAGF